MRTSPQFVGRAREVEFLRRELDMVLGGPGRMILLEGEAGIGKSEILEQAVEYASGKGFAIFRGAGDALESDRPFGIFVDGLGLKRGSKDTTRADIARLLVSESRPEPLTSDRVSDTRFLILESITELVERLALDHPMLLALEDVHWADPSSLLMLNRLARCIQPIPVGVIATARPVTRSSELGRILDAPALQEMARIRVDALEPESVVSLVENAIGAHPGEGLIKQAEAAAGNPLFILELIAALQQEGVIEYSNGRADVEKVVVPPSLRLTILRRLSFLSDDALETLRCASVLGSSFSLHELALVIGCKPTELLSSVEESMDARLLGELDERLVFRHEVVREAIYLDLPATTRRGLHNQAGRALAAAGWPALKVASQFLLGASPGDAFAIEWLRRASREAAPKAPGIAASLLGHAVELAGSTHPDLGEMEAELAVALVWSGRAAEGQRLATEALERRPSPELERTLRYGSRQALWFLGRWKESARQLEIMAQSSGVLADERARLLGEQALCELFSGNLQRAHELANQVVAMGEEINDAAAVYMGLCARAAAASFEAKPSKSLSHIRQAIEVAGQDRDELNRRQPQYFLGQMLAGADRLDEAETAFLTGLKRAEEAGGLSEIPMHHYALGVCHFVAGQWDLATVDFETNLSFAEETDGGGDEMVCLAFLAVIASHRDELSVAQEWLRRAEEYLELVEADFRTPLVQWARALHHEVTGDSAAALAELRLAHEWASASGYLALYRHFGLDLVRLSLAAGDTKTVEAVVEIHEEIARRSELPSAKGAALRSRGLFEDDVDALLSAVDSYRDGPRPLELAFACEDAGAALGRRGNGKEGRPLFNEAILTYERLGAVRDIARAEARMRTAGMKRGRVGPRRRPATGWESLTETELKIVSLVAEGLTNPQVGERLFISRRTVETHVSHALAKLGFTSRVELAAAAARRTTG